MKAKEALDELAKMVKEEIMLRIKKYGVNRRVGENTLEGSELQKSIEVVAKSDETIVFQIADHFQYVVLGWRRTGRYPNTMSQFVLNLTDWVRRKGIRFEGKTENQVVWAILKSIWTRGIEARPFLNYDEDGDPSIIIPFLDEYFDEWSDKVFDKITEELDKYFNE